MAHRYNQNRKDKSPQEKIINKLTKAQKRREQLYSSDDNYNDDELDYNPRNSRNPSPPRTQESYDIIRYDEDDKPVQPPDPVYFNELFGQGNFNNASRPSERHIGKSASVQRSRSVPPISSDARNRLGASFPFDAPNDEPLEASGLGNDNLDEYGRSEAVGDRRACRSRSPTKKVSYAAASSNDKLAASVASVKKQSSPIQCRYRADYVETDDSDLSFTVSVPCSRQGSRSQTVVCNRNSPQPQPQQLPPQPTQSASNSDGMFPFAQSVDDFANRNPSNYRVSNRYSQDSIVGLGSVSSNVYNKDVLPLPIEIPENVADAEAFRRYLSVRRGAITPVRHQNITFEKRNQSCPSYESIGRRPRKSSLGLTQSRTLGQEANRRTSSLSHAIMTLALLSASICQLRFLITYSHAHAYPILNYFLVFTSIILEVAAGIGYVLIARCSYDDVQSESIHNYLIFALFIVAISNVCLAAFAFDDHICDEIKTPNSRVSTSSTSQQQDQQFNQPASRSDRVMDLRYMPLE